jgi:hypothetical protein
MERPVKDDIALPDAARPSVPTCDAFAARLNGCQYGEEGSRELWAEMKAAGLVAVFGASDDLMEFRGAFTDEVGAYNGTTVFVTPTGLLEACDSECLHFRAGARLAIGLSAVWDSDGYSWTYKTAIPHATFDVMEGDGPYCRGIVFALSEATSASSVGISASCGNEPDTPPETGTGTEGGR